MSIPRRKMLSEERRKLGNAVIPRFSMKALAEIAGLDDKLRAGSLPAVANPAPDLLTPVAVLGLLLRAPIWVRERKNAGTVVIGNVDSWILAQSALEPDELVPVLQFGRSSNWFEHGLDFERWLVPLVRATNKDQMDRLLSAVAQTGNDTLIHLEQVNASVLARLTGLARETITKRLKRARRIDGAD